MKLFNFNTKKAEKLYQEGEVLSAEGRESEAIDKYLKAIELDPEKSESYYNLGLIHKYLNEWQLSLKYNQKAHELASGDEAALWNLAIAATALRDWNTARTAWQKLGIELEGKTGPINMNFGMTPIRLNPSEEAEVVWATRIDPARAKIDSIPLIESGFRHGDIVLHDGAAVGYRQIEDREYPVFNVLELFEQSVYITKVATVLTKSDDDLRELERLFSLTQHDFEDWTSNIRNLCRQCSEGTPHQHHDNVLETEWSSKRRLGVAAYNDQDVMSLFEEWQQKSGGKLLTLEG